MKRPVGPTVSATWLTNAITSWSVVCSSSVIRVDVDRARLRATRRCARGTRPARRPRAVPRSRRAASRRSAPRRSTARPSRAACSAGSRAGPPAGGRCRVGSRLAGHEIDARGRVVGSVRCGRNVGAGPTTVSTRPPAVTNRRPRSLRRRRRKTSAPAVAGRVDAADDVACAAASVGIAVRGEDSADGGFVSAGSTPVSDSEPGAFEQSTASRRVDARHDRLRLRIAQPHVELEDRAVRRASASSRRTAAPRNRRSAPRHLAQHGRDDRFADLVASRAGHPTRHRRVRAHAARVRPCVAVVGRL